MQPTHATIEKARWIGADAGAIAEQGTHLSISSKMISESAAFETGSYDFENKTHQLFERTRQLLHSQFRDPEYDIASITKQMKEEAPSDNAILYETSLAEPAVIASEKPVKTSATLIKQNTKLSGKLIGFGQAVASSKIQSTRAKNPSSKRKTSPNILSEANSVNILKNTNGNIVDKRRRLSDPISANGSQISKVRSIYDSGFEPTTFGHEFIRKRMHSQRKENSANISNGHANHQMKHNSNGQESQSAPATQNIDVRNDQLNGIYNDPYTKDSSPPHLADSLKTPGMLRPAHVVGSPATHRSPTEVLANNTKHQLMQHLKTLFPQQNLVDHRYNPRPIMNGYGKALQPFLVASNGNGGEREDLNGRDCAMAYAKASSQRFDPSGPCLLSASSLPMAHSGVSTFVQMSDRSGFPSTALPSVHFPPSVYRDGQLMNRTMFPDLHDHLAVVSNEAKAIKSQPSYRIGKGGGIFASNTVAVEKKA